MYCIHCGAQLPDDTHYCTVCGKPVKQPTSSKENFPDLERIATQDCTPSSMSLHFDTEHKTPVDKEPTHPIQEQIAPAPHYDDLNMAATTPPTQHHRKRFIALGVAACLLVIAAVAVALFLFHPWTANANQNGAQSISATPLVPPLEKTDHVDWTEYNGNWSAGGYQFSCVVEDGELEATLHLDDESYWDSVTLEENMDTVDLDFEGLHFRLKPRKNGTLRVAIDGNAYDAIRSNDLPPSVEDKEDTPTLHASDSGYLFYSPSTGTRSADGVIPEDRPDLHFWPLDQFAISTTDLDRLTQSEIDIIRNETFARHGYVFTSENWSNFFSRYDWYVPNPEFTEDGFTRLEKQNIDTIVLYEQEKGWIP